MSYIALYRNYRPTAFKDVAGQSHIITTLKNSIETNKTSHAYIFSGKRGIGKTTIARILAKAVNCLNPVNGEPCNECEHCKLINSSETPDIVELDAASNNGVEEMRNLLDKVNFLPSSLNKKVYIIDEVHMLTSSAFNALLKTLEEPPLHVMFILATTEPYKIPETILSRCQRFDFQQLSISEIVDRLKVIVSEEKIKIEEDVLYAIAESAEGGMRDAVNTLDQCSTYAEESIKVEDVDYLTGKVSDKHLINLVNSFVDKNSETALKCIDDLLNSGKDVSRIVSNLVQFLKDTLLYKSASNLIEEKNLYNKEEFKTLASKLNNDDIFFYIDILMDTFNKIKYSNSARIYLEVAVLKIINGFNNVEELSSSLKQLEETIQNGNFTTQEGTNPELELRVSDMNLQLKKVISELEKLDIRSFKEETIQKFKYFENTQTTPTSVQTYDDSKLLNIIDNLKTELDTIKANNHNDLENEIKSLKEEIKANNNSDSNEIHTEVDSETIIRLNAIEAKIEELNSIVEQNEKEKVELQKRNNPFTPKHDIEYVEKSIEEKQEEYIQPNLEFDNNEEISNKVEETVQPEHENLIEDKVDEPNANPFSNNYSESQSLNINDVQVQEEVKKNPYDVTILENIMHESRQKSNYADMPYLKQKWTNITSIVSVESSTVKILADGVLTVNGTNTVLIVYPNATYCNRLMSEPVHTEACKILQQVFGKPYDFLALPENTWNQKRIEYRDKYATGTVYPKLSPIDNPDLKIVEVKESKSSVDQLYEFAVSFFGEETVKKQ